MNHWPVLFAIQHLCAAVMGWRKLKCVSWDTAIRKATESHLIRSILLEKLPVYFFYYAWNREYYEVSL